jgi:hypothetical protein
MKILMFAFLGVLASCGGSSIPSASETLVALTNSRETMSSLSNLVKADEAKVLVQKLVAMSAWDGGNYAYPKTSKAEEEEPDTDLTVEGWFQRELDANRVQGDIGSNLFNRIDYALTYLCALTDELGENLAVTPEKILSTTYTRINSVCGTKMSKPEQVSLTDAKAVVEAISDAQFERKVSIFEKEDGSYPDSPTDEIYITNNASRIKLSFGYYEEEDAKRVYFDLDKTTGNLTVEYIEFESQEDGSIFQTIYRIQKTGDKMLAIGRSEQGTGSRYYVEYNFTAKRAKLTYDMGRRGNEPGTPDAGSVCINAENADVVPGGCSDFEEVTIPAAFKTLDLSNLDNEENWISTEDQEAPFTAATMFAGLEVEEE